jgi:hypothetical protein
MAEIVQVRIDWDRTAIPLRARGFHILHIGPEPGWPFGRKGRALAGAWRQLSTPTADGMLLLDGDVAVDPLDLAAMRAAIDAEPTAVHVAPARLWPVSTGQRAWIWGHGRTRFSQDDPDDPDVFGFSFTYLPRALIEGCALDRWAFPGVDRRVHQRAAALGIPVRVVRGCWPKHLNY